VIFRLFTVVSPTQFVIVFVWFTSPLHQQSPALSRLNRNQ
jgi:hypothetical protein